MAKGRFTLILLAFGCVYGALLFRLFKLQVQESAVYVAKAGSLVEGRLIADRGIVYFTDKNGTPSHAATNKDMARIYSVPEEIDDPLETAHRLAPYLGLDPEAMRTQFEKENDTYELLVKKANRETVRLVEELGIKGIYVQIVPERFYPFGGLASHVLGYVGPVKDERGEAGRYGVEELYDGTLAGTHGTIEGMTVIEPEAGKSIRLTIDPNVQTESERILHDLIEEHGAKAGTVIVEDPKTGKILAMASYPGFDPNNYQKESVSSFLNPATQAIYEPGSVFKVITMAAGIDAGVITPATKYEDRGSITVSGRKIQNWDLKAHGTVTMTNVIEQSLNTGAAYAAKLIGPERFRDYLMAFGFGDATGIDLPGEVTGDLKRLRPGGPAVAFATASFGQGVAVTPIGLLRGIAVIANGGVLTRPYVNEELGTGTGNRVISETTAKQVTAMMVSAVDKAKVAKIEGYAIAGKTGTAQVPDFEQGGYSENVIHSFAGFGPVADPKFAILVKLDEPTGAPLAGATVVPAFRDLAQFLINYYHIPPDRLE